jgi:hypothetical protein
VKPGENRAHFYFRGQFFDRENGNAPSPNFSLVQIFHRIFGIKKSDFLEKIGFLAMTRFKKSDFGEKSDFSLGLPKISQQSLK